MRKNLQNILLILALVALSVIIYDFACGHMNENPFDTNKCPLCQAHQSTEIVYFSLYFLLLGLFLTGTLLSAVEWQIPSFFFLRNISHKAPPLIP